MRNALPSTFLLLIATTVSSQTPASHSEALDLLTRVAQRYADAKSYDIESVHEESQAGELTRSWFKTILIAAEAPGGRSHFEGHTGQGSSAQISDGKTIWTYHNDEHRYTVKPFTPSDAPKAGFIGLADMGANSAKYMRSEMQSMVKRLKSAEFIADEKLAMDGHPVRCRVIHVRNTDEKRVDPNYKYDKKIWIDADRNVVLKIMEKADSFLLIASGRLPLLRESTTTYTRTVLDGPVDDALFQFKAPEGVREIADFPDPSETMGQPSLAGDPVPSLKFKAADGTVKPVESFRGKPVLIDFWATWCAPCVAAMPQLAALYKDAKRKGLVLISVDQDEDAAKATEFMKKHGYDWENFHDGDGAMAKLLPPTGIPHVMLVDENGIVSYDVMGGDENRLRAHVAKLGPQFADLAPKPQMQPCNVAPQSR
jgi:thiol-disulfide isomerase/thioredoxin/outer membrane lipoprotein-sorting protein